MTDTVNCIMDRLRAARCLVIKLGSSSVSRPDGQPRLDLLTPLVAEIHQWMTGPPRRGAILVSSGAIAMGRIRLGFSRRPATMPDKQAAAAVGQGALMATYATLFAAHGRVVAQVLLTAEDLRVRERFANAYRTFDALMRRGAVPIVNENDTVAVDEIRVGDNDTLAAMVAVLVEADGLVLLSDVDGLYTADPQRDPQARRVPLVSPEEVEAQETPGEGSDAPARPAVSGAMGTGGPVTKRRAAAMAARAGVAVWITRARPGVLADLAGATATGGTLVGPAGAPLRGRKRWIAFYPQVAGRLVVDAGAVAAVVERGTSLLPSGVRAVEGEFPAGSLVQLVDAAGREFARGLVNYDGEALRRIQGMRLDAVGEVLGRGAPWPEVIHRDNLVVTRSPAALARGA